MLKGLDGEENLKKQLTVWKLKYNSPRTLSTKRLFIFYTVAPQD